MACLEFRDSDKFILERNFFNVYPTLVISIYLTEKESEDFFQKFSAGDKEVIYRRYDNGIEKFVWKLKLLSYRVSYSGASILYSMYLVPFFVTETVGQRFRTLSELLAKYVKTNLATSISNIEIQGFNSFTIAYTLSYIKKSKMGLIGGKDNIYSDENLFIFVDDSDGGVSIGSTYKKLYDSANPFEFKKIEQLQNFQVADQVSLNDFYDPKNPVIRDYAMHAKFYFNQFIFFRTLSPEFRFGQSYKFINSPISWINDKPFICIRERIERSLPFRDLVFARRETNG